MGARPRQDVPRTLQNEWGLSLHVESARGSETRQVQIDFGFTADTLNNNIELMGVDTSKIDALVLTHGHYDHFGGIVGYLAAHKGKLQAGPAVLSRRRGVLLHPRDRPGECAHQLRRARPQGDRGCRPAR